MNDNADRIEQLHRIILGQDPARQFHKLGRGPVANTVTLTLYNGREMVEYTADHLRDAIDAAMKEGKPG